MNLKGAPELRRRIDAMSRSPRGYAGDWADSFVEVARPQIPVKTGATRASVQRAQVTNDGAEIVGSSVALWIDTGTRRHSIEPRHDTLVFPKRGQTIFARKVDHPGQRARPWRVRSLLEAARRNSLADRVIGAWNRAA